MAEEKNNKIFYFKYSLNNRMGPHSVIPVSTVDLYYYDNTNYTSCFTFNTTNTKFIDKFKLYMCDNMIHDPSIPKKGKKTVIRVFPEWDWDLLLTLKDRSYVAHIFKYLLIDFWTNGMFKSELKPLLSIIDYDDLMVQKGLFMAIEISKNIIKR
jgi:hypothetical protein